MLVESISAMRAIKDAYSPNFRQIGKICEDEFGILHKAIVDNTTRYYNVTQRGFGLLLPLWHIEEVDPLMASKTLLLIQTIFFKEKELKSWQESAQITLHSQKLIGRYFLKISPSPSNLYNAYFKMPIKLAESGKIISKSLHLLLKKENGVFIPGNMTANVETAVDNLSAFIEQHNSSVLKMEKSYSEIEEISKRLNLPIAQLLHSISSD